MPFEKIQAEKLSQSVARQIELLILRGILRPGERLPAERELAERLGVSRPSLREALAELQDRGLLISRANAGVFVAEDLGAAFSPALAKLFASHDEAVFDYLAFRCDLEGMAAERAATHASDMDLRVINTLYLKMEAAHLKRNPSEEAELDADFHLSIVEASHNVIMLHMMRAMFQLLRVGVFYNRQAMFKQRPIRQQLLEQHRAINDALQTRDPEGARKAVIDHLAFVERSLTHQRKADRNDAVARQRFQHEVTR
ncbi:FadR/GntR family transcriptional regulator [Ketogulonicigenium vulgare]|uniref:Pyruvate dehydrogenase complex repressor n=1 Tax=Ketogulonicigenium vulgare (strain WSH-001) TaxID=759362 RepID=F9Y7I2_KETVW|nr:FCD domain-containing protein [Ketogulonicigenium vulgare]ADO41288.1 pyruvate dehydrogenase complex repressor [Ketogulonicigenium vulgare Y25]AEM42278.1 Pyruvate dehydrogenase complex repressor [Ketogulonicigenium vulgare WSH-001]ALJ79897.1 GntR family transcriptional regulator [Ketogulonicigenium vulgare]ANW34831.1 GntR family transcriptional regulator [Ketogulonicigenium vulgare]AOZ53114.1 pyruvate dehydrogenase complex repressor [Ketogulonicigenium vulgare]